MYRGANTLTPLGIDILSAGLEAAMQGEAELHGFAIAKRVDDTSRLRVYFACALGCGHRFDVEGTRAQAKEGPCPRCGATDLQVLGWRRA
jgi:hypothetical protein